MQANSLVDLGQKLGFEKTRGHKLAKVPAIRAEYQLGPVKPNLAFKISGRMARKLDPNKILGLEKWGAREGLGPWGLLEGNCLGPIWVPFGVPVVWGPFGTIWGQFFICLGPFGAHLGPIWNFGLF